MPDSRNLPPGSTPEQVLARQIARLAQQLDDLRSTLIARPRSKLPTYTTAARPSASALGAGAAIYDTTLGKPLWSNGSVWRDAAGTAV